MSVHFNIPLTDGRALQTTSPAHRLALLRLLSARRLIAPSLAAQIQTLETVLARELALRESQGEPALRVRTGGELATEFFCASDDELRQFCEHCFDTRTPLRVEIRAGSDVEQLIDTFLSHGIATWSQRKKLNAWLTGEPSEAAAFAY